MVQICSSCNEKHSHLAEGAPVVPVSVVDGGVSGSTTGMIGNSGGGSGGGGDRSGGGNSSRCYTPSDNKSQANSESSNVRFKVNHYQ